MVINGGLLVPSVGEEWIVAARKYCKGKVREKLFSSSSRVDGVPDEHH